MMSWSQTGEECWGLQRQERRSEARCRRHTKQSGRFRSRACTIGKISAATEIPDSKLRRQEIDTRDPGRGQGLGFLRRVGASGGRFLSSACFCLSTGSSGGAIHWNVPSSPKVPRKKGAFPAMRG